MPGGWTSIPGLKVSVRTSRHGFLEVLVDVAVTPPCADSLRIVVDDNPHIPVHGRLNGDGGLLSYAVTGPLRDGRHTVSLQASPPVPGECSVAPGGLVQATAANGRYQSGQDA